MSAPTNVAGGNAMPTSSSARRSSLPTSARAADREYGARRAVVEDRKAAAAGEARKRAQRERRHFAEMRRGGGRHGQPGGCGHEGEAERGREQHHRRIGEAGNAGQCLMLQQVEYAGDQRETRHQEQGRGDEAGGVPWHRQAGGGQGSHHQTIDAGGDRCAHGGDRELVEPTLEQQ